MDVIFWHVLLWFIVVVCSALAVHHYKANRGFGDGATFFTISACALVILWFGIITGGCATALEETPSAKEPTTAEVQAAAFEETGIACAANPDTHTSGNICRVQLGDEICVTILPDDDTSTTVENAELISCRKATDGSQ